MRCYLRGGTTKRRSVTAENQPNHAIQNPRQPELPACPRGERPTRLAPTIAFSGRSIWRTAKAVSPIRILLSVPPPRGRLEAAAGRSRTARLGTWLRDREG